MKKCTATDNIPLVSILMAVYDPRVDWLTEQLHSLNYQTYNNLELIIYDDCPQKPVDEEIFRNTVTSFNYKIIRADINKGSNYAFEKLTELAEGKYVSYCDQDDIWNPDKVEKMVNRLEKTDSSLVCSDLYVIDSKGEKIADSISEVRKRHVFRDSDDAVKYLLVSNFVTGCAMMIKTSVAKKAVPFVNLLVHDQWLAIIAALNGKIEVIQEPLIGYRQHDNNQTGILRGVTDKNSYYKVRLIKFKEQIEEYIIRLSEYDDIIPFLKELLLWADARIAYSKKPGIKKLKTMLKYKRYAKHPIMIESVMPIIPNCVFKRIIALIQNGNI